MFDTATGTWVPADQSTFYYDTASGYYLSPIYTVDTTTGWYVTAPTAAMKSDTLLTAPQVVHTALGDLTVGTPDYKIAQMMGIIGPDGQPTGNGMVAVSGTGSGSDNQGLIDNSGQGWFDLTNLVNIMNTLQSTANSGNVNANSNTSVGNAVTGAASVISNLVNLLAAAWSWSNGDLSFFMQNITGNQNGNIMLDPTVTTTGGGGQLGAGSASNSSTGPNSTNQAGVNNSDTLNVNAKNSGSITNNVDLAAQSGDANVGSNTAAGDASSGNAVAEVNIINLINSFISSGNSFFGILNIFANLNGDILFPNGFLNGLVPTSTGGSNSAGDSNTGPNSSNQAGIDSNGQSNIDASSNTGIANNIGTVAASGEANVSGNTSAGSVGSGNATTTNSLFNLDNSQIFGDNAVLVIVNVLGHWVGKIMDLPGGSTESALLTGNGQVTSDPGNNASNNSNTGPNSSNQATVSNSGQVNANLQNNGTITNNVNVGARSGDVNATNNTGVGNVTTGDAHAASSVANIVNSVLNIKHWFGVLVINVFGNWIGDVNDNSGAASGASGSGGSSPNAGNTAALTTTGIVIRPIQGLAGVTSTSGSGDSSAPGSTTGVGAGGRSAQVGVGKVLTAAAHQPAVSVASSAGVNGTSILFGLSAGVMLIAGALVSIDKKLKRR